MSTKVVTAGIYLALRVFEECPVVAELRLVSLTINVLVGDYSPDEQATLFAQHDRSNFCLRQKLRYHSSDDERLPLMQGRVVLLYLWRDEFHCQRLFRIEHRGRHAGRNLQSGRH